MSWIPIHLVLWAVLTCQAAAAPWVQEAAVPLRIGVLAFRPKPETEARWRPLADYLNQSVPGARFQLDVYTHEELEQAVAAGRVEILLTQPSHYVALTHTRSLSSPLATLVEKEGDHALDRFGGVIFTRSDRSDLPDLHSLKGRTLALSTKSFLGGYQMQAYELARAGVRLPQDVTLVVSGQSHDQVVREVLEGRADAGLVRTGVLEAMEREGKADLSQIKVYEAAAVPGFPFRLSTRLYPEWPVAVLPAVRQDVARRVASALLAMPHDGPVARSLRIQGFTIPGDYQAVAFLMRELRLPPFDKPAPISLGEVWRRWQGIWIGLISAAAGLLILTVLRLLGHNRKLVRLQQEQAQSQTALRSSEQRFRNLANSGSALIWTSGLDMLCDYFNDPWLCFTGRPLDQELGDGWVEGVHPEDRARYLEIYGDSFQRREPFVMEYRLRHASGEYRWILDEGRPRFDSDGRFEGYIGHCYDVTERHHSTERLRQAASVFATAGEGIMITSATGEIQDVNQAFTWITGYSREEALGKNPRFLSAKTHDPSFYAEFWRSLCQEGYWRGEIWNRRKSGEIYVEWLTISAVRDDLGVTQRYVALFSDITAQKEHQKQLEHMAHFDGLTGLPNRTLLADRLQLAMAQVKRRGQLLAVAMIDLDGFKNVNDSHGHKAGDDLLMALANRMKESVREGDTVARVGGDEFVAVLADLNNDRECLPLIQRLLDAAAIPVRAGDLLLQVSGSLGFTFYPQGEEVDAEQLLRQADQAMYQAKLAGKNRYHIFDTERDRAMRGHHESLERIRQGLERDEFELHYQPKVNMRTGAVIGAEALVRWRHPERGLLSPAAFLPVIEEHPLGIELGHRVLELALAQIEAWKSTGLSLPVSVNVSALHLQEAKFVDELRALLARRPGVAPGDLEIEVLETSALEDVAQISRLIQACRKLGVEFALDDFGTGYSSLTYLKHLPARQLKIDQSFVHDMLYDSGDLAILEAVLGLVEALRREAIAEGVETLAHGDLLLRMGCELAQGYAIARPMPADQLPAWTAAWQPPDSWRGRTPTPHALRPLLFAAVEHRAWVHALAAHLKGERTAAPQDHTACRFGRWLAGEGRTLFKEHPAYGEVMALHLEIHARAEALIARLAENGAESVHPGLLELESLRDRMLERLDALESPAKTG